MGAAYVRWMDRLYWLCIWVSVASMVVMTGLICVGVFLRYVFGLGAQFAEPVSIFFAIQLALYGGAACLRARAHLRLEALVKMMPPHLRHWADVASKLLLGAVAVCMVVWGISLVDTTWFQVYPEFEYVKVGLVYTAIPGSGAVSLLFIIESLLIGDADVGEPAHVAAAANARDMAELSRARQHAGN